MPSRAMNVDKLYQGHLSEFTPLAMLHAPDRKRGHAHNHRRSERPSKKLMYTHWRGGAEYYCTFGSFLGFGVNGRHSGVGHTYTGAGPETSV